ncbi:hypothetical protein PJ900_01910 (plasmid) [Tistrella mobilis]|uniref:Uncharacterized protein n=1 Tax=Tistrella mobilis TaxID=171437 RepID=A0A162LJW0_9PROT|nr:hypothetical protein [Tistrella mobilis]KYO55309.1 hypothetical protein AUP44_23730 [Tistrella mobilis]
MLTRPDRATIVTLLAPPTVWALHFLTAYILAAIACAKGWDLGSVRLVIAAATAAALVFIVLAARAAHRHTGFTADTPPMTTRPGARACARWGRPPSWSRR